MSIKEDKLEEELGYLFVDLYGVNFPVELPDGLQYQLQDVVQAIKELVNG